MRSNVKRCHALVSCAVCRDQPHDHTRFVKQESAAVRSNREGSRTVFAVDLHDFLTRLLLIRTLYVHIWIKHRIV